LLHETMLPLLQVRGLRVDFADAQRRRIHALNGASLEVRPGEALGLLGESGSGKSTIAKASLGMLPKNASVTEGALEFEGRDVLRLNEGELQKLRGSRIAMIPQEPGLALNPVMKAGDQIAEVLRAHRDWSRKQCRQEAAALLERVHLHSSERRMYDAYPHQLSGGQQQRVAVAQALACRPALVIADEPTASLDPETEEEILRLLQELKAEQKMALLLITHDPKILEGLADRVAVMYGGRVIEDGSLEQVFREPRHPYTKALLACIPPPPGERANTPAAHLATIEGSAPDPELVAAGCCFAPRCADRMKHCESHAPSAIALEDAREVECFLYGG
jgi:oligopeptide/dipeptide ABC transporter ATP-binding protein